jgi:hypothetical protein
MTLEELLRQGKSFGQGASNAAASTVTGPVDMLAWLLRKGGVPVGDTPIGGEAWMRQKGLMATPENRLAGLLGEGAGLAAPIVAAAKAPEIAGGLLQMGRNLAAPQTMNKQTGAIVYHGSPHKFDKFDSSKIGTGEGAQAYGHGLYLAELPDVAGQYQKTLAADGFLVGDKVFDPSSLQHMNIRSVARKGDIDAAIAKASEISNSASPVANLAAQDLARLQEIKAAGGMAKNPGALYKVDLPDEHIAKMLDWDKPLSQQPKNVRDAYKKYLQSPQASEHAKSWTRYSEGMRLDQAEPLLKNPGGENLYKNAFPSRDAANQWATENGIPGIRYLDGGSRSAGAGSSNFVVFPGNEGLLKILERNGGKP